MTQPAADDNRWYPAHPMVAVHPVVVKEGKILLAKRAKEPSKGKWSLPGGRLELGETIDDAGKRELREECSIEIDIERLLDVKDLILRKDDSLIAYHFVVIYMLARYKSGLLKLNSENTDAGWFQPNEIAALDANPLLKEVLLKYKSEVVLGSGNPG